MRNYGIREAGINFQIAINFHIRLPEIIKENIVNGSSTFENKDELDYLKKYGICYFFIAVKGI